MATPENRRTRLVAVIDADFELTLANIRLFIVPGLLFVWRIAPDDVQIIGIHETIGDITAPFLRQLKGIKMKRIVLAMAFIGVSITASADTYVNGYMKSVPGHYNTETNAPKLDNYSSKGNVNPDTGKTGTVAPYKLPAPTDTVA